jgi:hypothetical protein
MIDPHRKEMSRLFRRRGQLLRYPHRTKEVERCDRRILEMFDELIAAGWPIRANKILFELLCAKPKRTLREAAEFV